MTVTELIQRLIELENEGGGGLEVWFDPVLVSRAPRLKVGGAGLVGDADDIICLDAAPK